MAEIVPMKIIARIRSDFSEKFVIPRQSGLVDALRARIVFEPEYRNADALRGLEGFSHIWLLWQFSRAQREDWSPTVRPPRLGGNVSMGVFATRSPFRPNPIGLSCVRLIGIDETSPDGPALLVAGADLMNGTPILDIKPYLPNVDSRPEATEGFAGAVKDYSLKVVIPEEWLAMVPESKREALRGVLAQDPRPGYRRGDARPFGVEFAGLDVRFTVENGVLTVFQIVKLS